MRASTLQNTNLLAINREIGSKYDVVKAVSEHLVEIEQLASEDIEGLIASLNEAKDFTGITVVGGTSAGWDAVSKVLTVPTVKGDTGAQGLQGEQGIQGIQGAQGLRGPTGLKGDKGDRGIQGPAGLTGAQGLQGPAGVDGLNLTVEQIVYNNDGTFTWHFSDETSYTTPDLRGPQGVTGDKGDKGDQGISVHHLKGTSTTDHEGDFGTFGELDTYTFYGDASETINLGYFTVRNGITPEMTEGLGIMKRSTYDTNSNGIVDNSERLEGKVAAEFVNVEDAQDIGGTKTFTGDVVIQGNLAIHGTETVVNSETVTTKDNQIVINDGEVGAGVTAGKAGIKVDRGTEPDYEFVFIEADDSFKIGKEGELQKVATREDTPIDTGLATWDASTSRFVTSRDVDVDSVSLGNGVLTWNPDEGTLDIDTGTGVIIQAGQENNRVVRNGTGSTIVNGTVVMVTGTIGNSGRLVVAPASGVANIAMRVYGVATQDIPAGQDGYVTIDGKVRGLDTTGSTVGEVWVDGDVLYVKPNDDGNLTKVVPTYGQLKMPVANVIHAHKNGTLEVRVTPIDENAYEPSNSNIQGHIIDTSNPHGVTKAQVGLGNVDDTSDADKPIGIATQDALDLKADADNTVLTGIPTAPTAAVGTDTTQLATTAFVKAEVASEAYSKVELDAGQLDNRYFTETELLNGSLDGRYYTETELLNGALDVRYYTESEIDAKLAAQNEASEINYDGTSSGLIATNVQNAIDEVENRLDIAETDILSISKPTKESLGLENVDNTSDANKPISTATQNALNTKVDTTTNQTIAGVKTFSLSPIVPTPTDGTQAVNKDYVDNGAGATFVANDNRVKTALNASGTAPIYANRAWANINGTGTVAIRASGNVSSITDNGTGNYTVNFTTAMEDVNYSSLALAEDATGGNAPISTQKYNSKTASYVSFQFWSYSGGAVDVLTVNMAIIR